MSNRMWAIFLGGLTLGFVLGVLISPMLAELLQVLTGVMGYVVAIAGLAAFGLLVVLGQDMMEAGFRLAEGLLNKSPEGAAERQQEEDRLPVNPWGWPNVFQRGKDITSRKQD